jgi:hypothetical protein
MLDNWFMPVYCLTFTSTEQREAIYSTETLVTFNVIHDVLSLPRYHCQYPLLREFRNLNESSSALFGHLALLNELQYQGTRDSVVVKTLCYKPEGRGFETR